MAESFAEWFEKEDPKALADWRAKVDKGDYDADDEEDDD